MGTYALITTWRATDATAAYFYTRGIANMILPPGFIPPELLKFLPEGANRFFIAPLLLPTAMIVNGCMYADVPSTSAVAVIALAVAAVRVYVLFVYGTFAFIGLRNQLIASVKAPPAGNGKDVGWISRILDQMAIFAFVFGSADALDKWRDDKKRCARSEIMNFESYSLCIGGYKVNAVD
jgi:hypothetical protein